MAFAEDYVDVAERLRLFKAAYPTGCLRPADPSQPFTIQEIGGREFIVYVAAAYRAPDDPMPAIAVAAEPAVGKTSFTRDSEVMNAETSAWGRAILAALAADSKKIASLDEVRNRRAEQAPREEHFDDLPPAPSGRSAAPAKQPSGRPKVGSAAGDGAPRQASGGSPSAAQINLMNKLIRETSTDIEFVSKAAGRDVAALVDLESREASAVIKALIEKKDGQ
jgi:hypothetical protein